MKWEDLVLWIPCLLQPTQLCLCTPTADEEHLLLSDILDHRIVSVKLELLLIPEQGVGLKNRQCNWTGTSKSAAENTGELVKILEDKEPNERVSDTNSKFMSFNRPLEEFRWIIISIKILIFRELSLKVIHLNVI